MINIYAIIILMWLDLSVAQAILSELLDYKSHELEKDRRTVGCPDVRRG